MKRYTVIKHFMDLVHENDVLIFAGAEVCKEAYQYRKDNCFYMEDSVGMAASFGLGLAMCTDKRIFVFLGEGELLRELGVLVQLGASRCSNMFLVLLDNGCYQSAGNNPTVFEGVLSKKGLIFNSNTKVMTYTSHFKEKKFKLLKGNFARIIGPLIILMTVDKGIKKGLPEIDVDFKEQQDRISKLILDPIKETAMYISPILPMSVTNTKTLNVDIDKLNTGGIS